MGGFEPMLPRRERRKLMRKSDRDGWDETFPERQTVCDFVNRWLEKGEDGARGQHFVLLMQHAMQDVAFDAILRYDLPHKRFAIDFSIVLSGHAGEGKLRPDVGAKWFAKDDEWYFGRLLGTALLSGAAPLVTTSYIGAPVHGEAGLAKDHLLPGLAAASERFKQFAAARGIVTDGFRGAMIAGDGAFHKNPVIEQTFACGFLPAYDVGGDGQKIAGTRELVDRYTGEIRRFDLRDDGAILCSCDAEYEGEPTSPSRRQPMKRKIDHGGASAYVSCGTCEGSYFVDPRKPDVEHHDGRRTPGDIDLRYDTTLPRWNKRVQAIAAKARNEQETFHSALQSFAFLPKARGGKGWRPLTGDFRHQFWYGLGLLLWNMRVDFNLSHINELQEMTWEEAWESAVKDRKDREAADAAAEEKKQEKRARAAGLPTPAAATKPAKVGPNPSRQRHPQPDPVRFVRRRPRRGNMHALVRREFTVVPATSASPPHQGLARALSPP